MPGAAARGLTGRSALTTGGSARTTGGSARTTEGAALTTEGAALTTTGRAWRTVSYAGVSLQVPASWPVRDLARHPSICPRLDVHAVYLGRPGPAPACPGVVNGGVHGKTETVSIEAASPASPDVMQARTPVTIDGKPARTNADAAVTHTVVDVLPEAGAEVSMSYGSDRALVRRIAATIRIQPGTRAHTFEAPAAVTPSPRQGLYRGGGFDTCAAPSAATMSTWLASPYRGVGIYIGGVNRACAQASLTAAWIAGIQAQGWHYAPLYPGLQASCVSAYGDATITPSDAAAEGSAAAADAVTQARNLGIPRGTPLTYDMEGYNGCGTEVVTFLSSWDAGLHAKGYRAGVYESFSNISDLVQAAGTMTEPDVIYYADWDGQATTKSSYMPTSMWTHHQRIHQYQGGHNETWGGVTLNIDSDQFDVNLGWARRTRRVTPAGFRVAPARNASGSAEWFATAASGKLVHDYQHATGAWSGVRVVRGSPRDITANPSVITNPGGTLEVFARDSGSQVVHAWQHTGSPGGWEWGGPVPARHAPASTVGDPAAIALGSGAAALFVAEPGGAVAVARRSGPGEAGTWARWRSIGGSCVSTPVPLASSGGTLQVFCVTNAGTAAADTDSGHGWSGWQTLGSGTGSGSGPTDLTGTPAAALSPRGQPELFATTSSGELAHAWQKVTTGAWTWGTPLAGTSTDTQVKDSPAVIGLPGGHVEVLAELTGGQLGYARQRGRSGSGRWSAWTSADGTGPASNGVGSPAGWVSASGAPQAIMLDSRDRVSVASFAGGSWTGWTELGGGF